MNNQAFTRNSSTESYVAMMTDEEFSTFIKFRLPKCVSTLRQFKNDFTVALDDSKRIILIDWIRLLDINNEKI